MSPLEAAIRAACAFMGADPAAWENFKDVGQVAAEAFVDAFDPELRVVVRRYLDGTAST